MSMLILPDCGLSAGPHGYAGSGEIARYSESDMIGLTRNGQPEHVLTRWGRGVKSSATNNYSANFYLGPGDAKPRYSFMFACAFVPLSNNGWDIFAAPVKDAVFFDNNNGSLRLFNGSYLTYATAVIGQRYDLVFLFNAATSARSWYVNGKLVSTGSGYLIETGTFNVGSGYSGYGNGNTAILGATLQLGVLPSAREAAEISTDWVRALPRRDDYLFFDATVAQGTQISWSSLTASNITQTTATLTLGGITR